MDTLSYVEVYEKTDLDPLPFVVEGAGTFLSLVSANTNHEFMLLMAVDGLVDVTLCISREAALQVVRHRCRDTYNGDDLPTFNEEQLHECWGDNEMTYFRILSFDYLELQISDKENTYAQ